MDRYPFLFNLERDPGEHNDVSIDNPDVVEKLTKLYEGWEKDIAATPPPFVHTGE